MHRSKANILGLQTNDRKIIKKLKNLTYVILKTSIRI